MSEPGVRPPKLSEQIAADLTRDVHAGQIEPGTRLPTEAVLGARYGVSRSAVREAMSMLRSNGVIESRRGSGSFVIFVQNKVFVRQHPESRRAISNRSGKGAIYHPSDRLRTRVLTPQPIHKVIDSITFVHSQRAFLANRTREHDSEG